jgi:phosphatidate cytidylyltransferase
MKRILTAVVLIAAVLAILLAGPQWLLTLAAAAVALLAAYEYRALADAFDVKIPLWWLLLATAATFYLTLPGIDHEFQLPVLTLFTFILLGWSGFRAPLDRVLADTAFGVFGLLYVVYPLTLIPILKAHRDLTDGDGTGFVLFLFVCVWAGDIAALYIGRNFGRRKLAPRLSPNKTVEGAIASIAGSILCGMGLYFLGELLAARLGYTKLHIAISWWHMLLLAAVLNLAAQLGDLLESAIKRGAGVKDSGTMLPGHGGILDRIDALLLAAPVLWYILLLKDWQGLLR